MSRYIPVAARRRALEIYRDRRRGGGDPFDSRPRNPYDAMRATMDFFSGHYTSRMAYGWDTDRVQALLDGYRAADWYLKSMRTRPWRNWPPAVSYSNHKWRNIRITKTSAKTGAYTFTYSDAQSASYRAVSAATGSAWGSTSKTVRPKTVATKPPKPVHTTTPQSCYPLTNGGNCYEPGEFCRASDHGSSGVAGDGEAISCSDNNGWRWEPV